MSGLPSGYHIIEIDFDTRPHCRVCGAKLEDSAPRHRGYVCAPCNNEYQHEYYYQHRALCGHIAKLSYAKRRGAEGSYTQEEWQAKLQEHDNRCVYCGVDLGESPVKEHNIPLSRGGTNYIDNIVPACMTCNSTKHTKTGEEYREEIKI